MGSGGTEVGGWVVPRFDTPIDASLVAMLQDLWLPAIYHHWEIPAIAVSVDITTQFRAALPPDGGARPTACSCSCGPRASLGGMVDEDCEIWSRSGELLSQGRQLRFVH